jgi:hypothetical protein
MGNISSFIAIFLAIIAGLLPNSELFSCNVYGSLKCSLLHAGESPTTINGRYHSGELILLSVKQDFILILSEVFIMPSMGLHSTIVPFDCIFFDTSVVLPSLIIDLKGSNGSFVLKTLCVGCLEKTTGLNDFSIFLFSY